LISPLAAFARSLWAISPGTANLLAYSMLVVVAVFLVTGPIIVYIYYKKRKREMAADPASSV
jgi:hypothetical protein